MSHEKTQKRDGDGEAEKPAPPRPNVTTGLKLVEVRTAAESIADREGPATSLPAPRPRLDTLVGATIDNRYKVEAVLGEGGMGVVYRCRHKIIDKKVAMKVLRADLARDHEVTERFLLEAKAASTIGDDHIIDISDFGVLPDGATYFVMEYLDGQPLSNVLEGGTPVPLVRLLHIARQLAEGLLAAHSAGIVHRDLKPDNIFLVPRGGDRDFVKILDFGIAKVSTSSTGQLTRAGSVFGTPHYMSPEQAAGAGVDHRGDIYSLGVILYEMASGKVPFDADNFMGILTQHMYKAPVPIRALVPPPDVDVPPGLEAIILKCLSKRAEQRYPSMQELIDDLRKLQEGLVPEAVSEMMARSGSFAAPADYFKSTGRMPVPVPASPESEPERRALPVVAVLGGAALAIAVIAIAFARSSPTPAQANTNGPAHSAVVVAPPPPEETPPPPVAVTSVPSRPVAVAIEPSDAEVFENDKSLGTSPVVVNVTEGQARTLEARRSGYVSEKFVVDGSAPRKVVRLDKTRGAAGTRATHSVSPVRPVAAEAPKAKSKSSIGGGEIVNPWAK